MEHVPNVRNHSQVTLRNLRVKAARLLSIDDTILRARHDNNWHCQFLIAMPHREGAGNHGDTVLAFRADLPGSHRHVWNRTLREAAWDRERREHSLERQWLHQSAKERGDRIPQQ